MIDHVGERYCSVVIVRDLHRNGFRGHLYECRCDCGQLLNATLRQLRNAEVNMCATCKEDRRKGRM